MKTTIGICLLFALVGISNTLLTTNTNAARVCVIRLNTCNWSSTVSVCGRQGTTSFCKKFQNRCQYMANACAEPNVYTLVNNSLCTNLAVNSRGLCQGSTAAGSGLFANLFGLSSSSTNTNTNTNSRVQPIVIRV